MPGAKPLQMADSRHAPNTRRKPRIVDAGRSPRWWGMVGDEGNRQASIGRSGQGAIRCQFAERHLVVAGLGCTRFRQPLTDSVEQCPHVVCRGAGVLQHGQHHRVSQQLLNGRFALADVHGDAHSHPKQQGREARAVVGRGSRGWPCCLPESRMAGDLERGCHCTARLPEPIIAALSATASEPFVIAGPGGWRGRGRKPPDAPHTL
jgi:hypothetical protein